MPEQCAFCPSVATLTGEHVWSDWMNQLFPGMAEVTFQNLKLDGTVVRQWRAQELNLKVKVVCDDCNSGWMSIMERDFAMPAMTDLILGNRIGALSRKRARGLSLFAFKTAVIANRSLPESEWFFSAAERYAFRKSFAILPRVKMFLVGIENFHGGRAGSHNVFFPDRDRPHLSLNVCSFSVGQLGFQVVSAKGIGTQKVESLRTPPNLTACFYPTLDRISWPRRHVLGVKAFNDFANRWNSLKWH
jgi:hypothetical protein